MTLSVKALARGRRANATYRAKKKLAGLCPSCAEPVESGRVYCRTHRLAAAERAKDVKARYLARGGCASCGKPRAEGSKVACEDHLEKNRLRRKRRWLSTEAVGVVT